MTVRDRVGKCSRRMRARVLPWGGLARPDVRTGELVREARLQAPLIALSDPPADDQYFIEAVAIDGGGERGAANGGQWREASTQPSPGLPTVCRTTSLSPPDRTTVQPANGQTVPRSVLLS